MANKKKSEFKKLCQYVKNSRSLKDIESMMRAFRVACRGDSSMRRAEFKRTMLFVLVEMDGVFRSFFELDSNCSKKEMKHDLSSSQQWETLKTLVRAFLRNGLHFLKKIPDTEIDLKLYTLNRLRSSCLFLAVFPRLSNKYAKVLLQSWGTNIGDPISCSSFRFLRDLCEFGVDCFSMCLSTMYDAYMNYENKHHVQFIRHCCLELIQSDLSIACHDATSYIRKLPKILTENVDKEKREKEKICKWRYIRCAELWTAALRANSSSPGFGKLVDLLQGSIMEAAHRFPTARYIPFRLQCVRMLNQIAVSTHSFIPSVISLLLETLGMEEFKVTPVEDGKAINFGRVLKVSNATLNTRCFQEVCVTILLLELAEHFTAWSNSVMFPELSQEARTKLIYCCNFVAVGIHDRIMVLDHQIHRTVEYIEFKRNKVEFHPSSFIESRRYKGKTEILPPIQYYLSKLYESAQQLDTSIMEFSVFAYQDSAIIGFDKDDDEIDSKGHAIFSSSSWMPGRNFTAKQSTNDGKQRKRMQRLSTEEASVESESPPKKKRKCKEKNEKIGQGEGEEEEKQETKKQETEKRKRKDIIRQNLPESSQEFFEKGADYAKNEMQRLECMLAKLISPTKADDFTLKENILTTLA